MLAFLDYYRLIDVDLFKICYLWSVLDLHVEETHVLPVSQFCYDPHATQKRRMYTDLHVEEIHVLPVSQVFFIIYDPHATQKHRMYSGYRFFCLSLHTGCLPWQKFMQKLAIFTGLAD